MSSFVTGPNDFLFVSFSFNTKKCKTIKMYYPPPYRVPSTLKAPLFVRWPKLSTNEAIGYIELYTPINYFGRYATCSHDKDGGRTHIQSRETIGRENHVTCVKLSPRVNFVLRSEPPPRRLFSINTLSSNTLPLFYPISSQRQHTPSSVNQEEWKATTWKGLADIKIIHWQWDCFQS